MDIYTFMKAYALYKADASSDVSVVVSDINHDNQITEGTFEQQCEWRQPYRSSVAEPVEKPESITWSAIATFQSDAEAQPDFTN